MNEQPPLRLEEPSAIPPELFKQLSLHDALLRISRDTEDLIRRGPLSRIAEALSAHFRAHRIRGYHCTREPMPGYFAAQGLRATNVRLHQDEFLQQYGHYFSSAEHAYMLTQWAQYFDSSQLRAREGRVWACLTRALVQSSGASHFLRAFGGEALYMPLAKDSSAALTLMTLGLPVVVEVVFSGDRLQAFCEAAWCALNYHHRRINPTAYPMESEGFVRENVSPSDVICVVPFADFALAVK